MTDKGTITPSQRKKLLGRSHQLNPLLVVGHAGTTDAVISQIKHILKTHDLIKVRIEAEDRQAVQAAAEELATRSEAMLVTKIGKIAVLYKALEEDETPVDRSLPPRQTHKPRRPR
jgi:RNA-binding protein